MNESVIVLSNENTRIEYNVSTKRIFGKDLKDRNNEPAFYNKTVRSIKKAWKALEESFTPNTTMYEATNILRQNGIKTHEWCMMD